MNKTFTTPRGVAYYPYISAPDTKFDEQGHYKVNLCIPKEEAQPIIEQIKGELVAGIKALKEAKPNAKIKQAPLPFEDELDEDDQATGNVIIKFKSKAAYKPAIFDSKGTPMMKSNIYAGSILKVNGSIAFYNSPAVGAGVTLRLRAVQVIEYVEGAVGATKFGFGEETGFTIEDQEEVEETTPEVVVEEKPTPEPQAAKTKPKPQPVEPTPVKEVSSDADDLASEIANLLDEVNTDD
jgi:hypothetical protein|tara:strand:- start:1320 stop:2033 length:714 start_codon:yes stop_codon:yes gene_type:complete